MSEADKTEARWKNCCKCIMRGGLSIDVCYKLSRTINDWCGCICVWAQSLSKHDFVLSRVSEQNTVDSWLKQQRNVLTPYSRWKELVHLEASFCGPLSCTFSGPCMSVSLSLVHLKTTVSLNRGLSPHSQFTCMASCKTLFHNRD